MSALKVLLLALAVVGHAAFCVGLVNRWHSFGFPRRLVKTTSLVIYAAFYGIPLAVAWQWFAGGESTLWDEWPEKLDASTAYLAFAAAYGAIHIPIWAVSRWRTRRLPKSVSLQEGASVDIERNLGFNPARGMRASLLTRVPGNQLWQLEVSRYAVELQRLPRDLEGLSVCHWSDLHISRRIDRAYFEEVARLTNQMRPDVIALSGDVCDVASLIDWIPETLGAAKARVGKYFILGNHDLRTHDVPRLRGAMREAGFIDVGGRQEMILDGRVMIAGDERPWFRGEPALDGAAPRDALKILLAHTPDRLRWARSQGFDLMLAGHTHGGQICFPLIGPTVCPSWHGTKYAAGFFYEPPTLAHVCRGTASLFPLRINCPPELSMLVLRGARN